MPQYAVESFPDYGEWEIESRNDDGKRLEVLATVYDLDNAKRIRLALELLLLAKQFVLVAENVYRQPRRTNGDTILNDVTYLKLRDAVQQIGPGVASIPQGQVVDATGGGT